MSDGNFKKLLCYNTIKNLPCSYNSKCLFAHNLDEQYKDPYRQFVYKMAIEFSDLSNINIYENNELLSHLITCTHECINCANEKCSGGYNCKYGCLSKYKICYNDLMHGRCQNKLTDNSCCNGHHLTQKNLIPYYQHIFIKNINIKEITDLTNLNKSCIKQCSFIKLNDNNIDDVVKIIQ